MHNRLIVFAATLALAASSAALAGDAAKGKEKAQVCAACHGADGNSAIADFPKLAGQYPDYIIHSLRHYKSGKRKNPIMAPLAATLSEEDMADLAAYFYEQKGVYHRY